MENCGKTQITLAKNLAAQSLGADNKKLNALYQKFVESNIESYSYGLMLPLLDYQDTTFLSDELHKILQKRGKDSYFNLLTMPPRESNVKREELELLEIYLLIFKNQPLQKLFLQMPTAKLLPALKQGYPKIYSLLKQHTEKFCWVYYVYQGPAANMEYFADLLKDLTERKVDPNKKLKDYNNDKKTIAKEQSQALQSLGLNNYERQIVLLACDGVFYKAQRRELQSCSYYYMEAVLTAIAQKLNLSLTQVRMMLANEVADALLKNKVDINLLNSRKKIVFLGRTDKTTCLTGKKATNYLRKNTKIEKLNLNVKEVTGTVAYPGKAKGTVKIINSPKEMEKMRRGDILVAQTTNPNLMPVIRQAAAIVTDEGGLTCHAAIVSRELKIPCVVGTKIASKFLKDGDMVEVDANKGIVKKL